jgi:preprotein translocase subunit SecY
LPIGAFFLGIIALAPSIVGRLTGVTSFEFLVGGTSLLIMVSVVLESYQEINAYLKMQEL